MKKFLQFVKKAASDVFEAKKPCDFFYGTVKSTEPFTLKIDGISQLPEELLVFADARKSEFVPGDKVIVLRKSGGQKYLILGRCVE